MLVPIKQKKTIFQLYSIVFPIQFILEVTFVWNLPLFIPKAAKTSYRNLKLTIQLYPTT